jgi:hypothetical protein
VNRGRHLAIAIALGLAWPAAFGFARVSGQTAGPALPARTGPGAAGIVVDHTSVALFDRLPADVLARARATRVLLRSGSVGANIGVGLDCLADNRPNHCRTGFAVPAARVPVVSQPQYDRTNWLVEFRGNPGWYGKVKDFLTAVETRTGFQVITWKFGYVEDPTLARFWDRARTPSIAQVEAAAAAHPDVRFVYWTAALAKVPMTHIAQFNEQMRMYASARGLPLMDLADIESHRPDGTACAVDGVPVICGEYASEPVAGHLSNGMAQQRAAMAFWVLVARLAGWIPAS